MQKRVILTLLNGSFEQGFPVVLRILGASPLSEIQDVGKLPSATEVLVAFNNWQSAYTQWQSTYRDPGEQTRRIKTKPAQVTNFSYRQIGLELESQLNQWLNSSCEEWQNIRDRLLQNLSKTDEIEVIIQTENKRLRQLPWHLWDLFSEHYPKAEVALSAIRCQLSSPLKRSDRVRILAILGNSTGINVEEDRAILEQLPDARITFLKEPQRQALNDLLWEQAWDILFFAGHSCSQSDSDTGQIHINQQELLSLQDLKHALRKTSVRGLQLAILNSCDGLGLAYELADLNIPQIIVMRKAVPDRVAQEFLKHFLRSFSQNKPLYLSVRESRERLQSLEGQFPFASWLPVICQNPLQKSTTWENLRTRESLFQRLLSVALPMHLPQPHNSEAIANARVQGLRHPITVLVSVASCVALIVAGIGLWQLGGQRRIPQDQTSDKPKTFSSPPPPQTPPSQGPEPEEMPTPLPQTRPEETPPTHNRIIDTWESPVGGTRVDLVKAAVSGETLTVELHYYLSATPNSSTVIMYPVDQVSYTDDVTSKVYKVLKDESGVALAQPLNPFGLQDSITMTRPLRIGQQPIGQRLIVVWFKFPAPPEEARTIAIHIPEIPTFDDIEIQR